MLTTLTFLALGYIAACAFLYLTQERSIFYPGPNDPGLRRQYEQQRVEIAVQGATLEGWLLENPGAQIETTILYFGGNAEDVLYTASTLSHYNARRMLVVNYRGYGGSTGRPGQEALYQDGLALYDFLIRRGVAPESIVVMGRSLGSGVASMIAAERPVRAAVLITPFDSLAAVAAGHYPFFPVKLLLKHPFRSIDWVGRTKAPAMMIAAEKDNIVPASRAQALFDAWRGPKEIHVLPGTGHNDIQEDPNYYRLINAFLAAPR
jgi:uncharacterized protein